MVDLKTNKIGKKYKKIKNLRNKLKNINDIKLEITKDLWVTKSDQKIRLVCFKNNKLND